MDEVFRQKTLNGARLLLTKVRGQLLGGEAQFACYTLFVSVVPLVASLCEETKGTAEQAKATMQDLRAVTAHVGCLSIEWLILGEVERLLANPDPDPLSLLAALQWLGCIVNIADKNAMTEEILTDFDGAAG